MRHVVVSGSLNWDRMVRVEEAPLPGQTVIGSDPIESPGGKGLNQAAAAARTGAQPTRMIGRIGADVTGEQLRTRLADSGVDIVDVRVTKKRSTGEALIVVDRHHQNRIVVSPGANDTLRPTDVKKALARFDEPPAAMLLQLESPMDTVTAAASEARRKGAAVILDPAPVQPSIPKELLRHADFLTPNESEALALLGEQGHDISLEQAPRVAERLRERTGADTVILKMGAKGAWIHRADFNHHVRAPKVDAVDTTAAGDTFNGALAAMLTEAGALEAKGRRKNQLIASAVEFANCAAAISVTRKGALDSIPTRAEVVALWRRTFAPAR